MRSNFKNLLTYGIAIALLAIAIGFISKSFDFEKLQSMQLINLGPLLGFGFLTFLISGVYYKISNEISFQIKLSVFDLITLPFSVNLLSYVIPFQGSTLYSTAFYKIKYNLQASKGLSITLFSYALSVSFTGILGLYFSGGPKASILLFLGSLVLTLNPLFLIIFNWILLKFSIQNSSIKVLAKTAGFTNATLNSFRELTKNKKLLTTVLIYNIIHSIVTILWFYFAAIALSLDSDFIDVALLALFTKLSLILRVTPGNLGVEQLLSGAIFGIAGANVADGMAISVLVKSSALLNTLIYGSLGVAMNMKYFKFSSIAELTQALKSNASK